MLFRSTHPELPGVPTLMDYVSGADNRGALEVMFTPQEAGRPFAAPPEIPADRAAALRRAFDAALKDKALLAEAERAQIEIDPITGDLRSDPAARSLAQTMRTLTTTKLVPGDDTDLGPKTLADLGVRTEKDGTLSIDQTRLAKTLSDYPGSVEKMFQASGDNLIGLSARMNSVQLSATSSVYGLTASYNNLTQQQSDNSDAQAKLEDSRKTATDTMTARFASMNSRVSRIMSSSLSLPSLSVSSCLNRASWPAVHSPRSTKPSLLVS